MSVRYTFQFERFIYLFIYYHYLNLLQFKQSNHGHAMSFQENQFIDCALWKYDYI